MDTSVHAFSASPATVHQQLHSFGHDIRYEISLYNAAALQEWTFTQNYIVPCNVPTSWVFAMHLYRGVISGRVFGDAILKRIDSLNISVDAHFVLTFKHNDFTLDFIPTQGDGMIQTVQPGEVLSTYIDSIVPIEMSDLLRWQILGSVQVSVRYCHGKRKKGGVEPGSEARSGTKGVA